MFSELTFDFVHHFHGSFTDRLHGHGRKPERQIGTCQEKEETKKKKKKKMKKRKKVSGKVRRGKGKIKGKMQGVERMITRARSK